jgi:endonuclease YncB( thermonuclease family)
VTTWTVPAEVVRVVDGDTLVCTLDLGWGLWRMSAHVRLARVNAPELKAPGGQEARDYVQRLLADSIAHGQALPSVTLISHSVDKYGRTLADVIVPDGALGFNLNDLLLSSGHAVPM